MYPLSALCKMYACSLLLSSACKINALNYLSTNFQRKIVGNIGVLLLPLSPWTVIGKIGALQLSLANFADKALGVIWMRCGYLRAQAQQAR